MWPIKSLALAFSGHLLGPRFAGAAITVYYQQGQNPFGVTTTSVDPASYTGAAAYDPTVLEAPRPPDNQNYAFDIQLQKGGSTTGLSIPQNGAFVGFSIEMSVVNQMIGINSSFIQVPFLNLMANIQQRAGRVFIRVGGNTQETATMVESTADGRILEKDVDGVSNPTQTPPLIFTPELLKMLRSVSSLVDVRWFLGIPFNDTSNFRLGIAEAGQQILGDYLAGLQVGNEPDLYARHGHRPETYGPQDYFNEFGSLVQALSGDENTVNRRILVGPNIASADWQPEQVWDTGFIDAYTANLAYLAVEHYPTDNCFAQFGVGTPRNAQDIFPDFLQHGSGVGMVAQYLASTALAQAKGKPFMMFETNTASCGGFPGLSDSFGAALWGLDYSLQMAYGNFSGALMHVGGQNVFYNPFTPPPTNQSIFHQWTVGPIYYTSLVMAEVLGASNQAQVLDLQPNNNSPYTPAYAIYEDGDPVRVALFNYVTDPSGASDVTATIKLNASDGSSALPTQVKVKYLAASSVSQKYNFTWAGQTFGDIFQSDGRFMGSEDVQTVNCDATNNACQIHVPAPGFALVFLTSTSETETAGAASTTFATTATTNLENTATIDPDVLATSNGHTNMKDHIGSTSRGSASAAESVKMAIPGLTRLVAIVVGLAIVKTPI